MKKKPKIEVFDNGPKFCDRFTVIKFGKRVRYSTLPAEVKKAIQEWILQD
jgi:hypothetical protein